MHPLHRKYYLVPITSTIGIKTMIEDFDCGNENINKFLKEKSLGEKALDELVTFILIDGQKRCIAGFFSSTTGSMEFAEKQENDDFEKSEETFINLAYFAIDKRYQRRGLGRSLMVEFFRLSLTIAFYTKISMIYLESVDESVNFYKKLGYKLQDERKSPEKYHEYNNDTTNMDFPMLISIPVLLDNGYLPYNSNFADKGVTFS